MKSRTELDTDGALMSSATRLAGALERVFPDLCLAIASDDLVPLHRQLERIHSSFVYMRHVDDAIALAAGNAMAGKRSMVVMRADCLDQCGDTLDQLVKPFRLPMGLVVGDPEDESGEPAGPALDGLATRSLRDGSTEDVLRWFENTVGEQEFPAVLSVPSRSLGRLADE